MDSQRLQGLIDGNKKWLELRKKDTSMYPSITKSLFDLLKEATVPCCVSFLHFLFKTNILMNEASQMEPEVVTDPFFKKLTIMQNFERIHHFVVLWLTHLSNWWQVC